MRALTGQELLSVWESGRRQHLLDRALTLLGAAMPGRSRRELAALSIGTRDALLISVYERSYGRKLSGSTDCPSCREAIEFSLDTSAVRVPGGAMDRASAFGEVSCGGVVLRFRAPTSADLAAVAGCRDLVAARRQLAGRCVLASSSGGQAHPLSPNELSEEQLAAVAAKLADLDPQAEILIGLACPSCKNTFELLFDIAAFLWERIVASSRRLLTEIHTLARAYGWREADILLLSAERRQSYLGMVGA